MKVTKNINVENKRVFIRTDYDVPLKNGKVNDDSRLRDSSETIKWLIENGAYVIICSSIGRPNNKDNDKSLKHIIKPLTDILCTKVLFSEYCIGEARDRLIKKLSKGEVLLLENVRFHKEEYQNDNYFSKLLSEDIDIYINDAFGNSHRKHASMVGILNHIKEKVLGFHLQKEVHKIDQFVKSKESPSVGIIGGNKTDKIDAITNMSEIFDKLVIVGEIASHFLFGINNNSPFKKKDIKNKCLNISDRFKTYNNFILPVDLIAVDKCFSSANAVITPELVFNGIYKNDSIIDIGPKTIENIDQLLHKSKLLVWNGPAGKYEEDISCRGSISIVNSINNSKIKALIGGGDTLTVFNKAGVHNPNVHTVSGGGALLTILKGKKLVAVDTLIANSQRM